MPRPRDQRTHDRILDAAAALHRDVGAGFSLADVAARAGVSRGSIYRRFASHAELLERLVAERGVDPEAVARPSARDRILDAVGEVLRTRDFAALTVDEIAAAASVGVATVFRQFGDRDGLLAAFASERTPRRFAAELALRDGENLEDDLRRLAAGGIRFLLDYPHLMRILLMSGPERARLPAPFRESDTSARRALEQYFARQVSAGRVRGEPATLARLLLGMAVATVAFGPGRAPAGGADMAGGVDRGAGWAGEADGADAAGAAERAADAARPLPRGDQVWIDAAAATIVGVLLRGCLSEHRTDDDDHRRTP